MKTLFIAALVAVFTAFSTLPITAAEDKAAVKKEATARAVPFGGKIASVDKQAKTVTVGKRVLQVTSDTKITKNEKPATLDDATVGEEVGGQYHQDADKKMNLVSLRIGPKAEAPKK